MVYILLRCIDRGGRTVVNLIFCESGWKWRTRREEEKIHRKNIYGANSGAHLNTGIVSILYIDI